MSKTRSVGKGKTRVSKSTIANYVQKKDDPTSWISFSVTDQWGDKSQTLPPGVYKTEDVGGPFAYIPKYNKLTFEEKLIRFKSGTIGDSLSLVDNFYSPGVKAKYDDLGITHKMGILYYGPPGTGKTCSATMVMMDMAEKYGAICLDMTGKRMSWTIRLITEIRKHQDNPIVVFYDEAENSINSEENEFLQFLDGTNSVNGLVFIGCTNYIDKIPDRIKNRPSRIRYCLEVKSLPSEVYRDFLFGKWKDCPAGLADEIVYLAMENGLTMDQFKHMIIEIYIDDVKPQAAMESVSATV